MHAQPNQHKYPYSLPPRFTQINTSNPYPNHSFPYQNHPQYPFDPSIDVVSMNLSYLQRKAIAYLEQYLQKNHNITPDSLYQLCPTRLISMAIFHGKKVKIKTSIRILNNNQPRPMGVKLFQLLQVFLLRENKENSFHYVKLLKNKATKKQRYSIKKTINNMEEFCCCYQRSFQEAYQ